METPQPTSNEQVQQAKSRKGLVTVLGLVIIVALVCAGAFWVHNSDPITSPTASETSAAAARAPKPVQNKEYEALQAVVHKPSVADNQGGIIVSKEGVGRASANVPTFDIYMDFLCPPCASVHRTLDPSLEKMIQAGQINVGMHFMDFLDRTRSDQYSSRTASAAATVAQEDPKHFFDVVASFYAEDFQPAEEAGKDISDEQLAERMMSVGVPESVAKKAASGEYIEWTQKLNAYTVTRAELAHPDGSDKGKMTTPTIIINNTYLQINHIRGGADDVRKALYKAIGLDENQVGKAGSLPAIGATGKPNAI
ncbi:protein disulfide-isomerase [Bombiscardovia apis]|uniref:Protein disulfide-isomerase n=1 Tax=Bombiscardovia apis TaxID=2932182 RepID=A0ABN6SFC6_9BIFI|nr:thioredoxin domain-containing protein [Bombiscardovia apis]BDR54719.1 protein disulfide-isomerase [Bombiscardovia apis]